MEKLEIDLEAKNLSNEYSELKVNKLGENKAVQDMVEAGDGAHVADILPANRFFELPVSDNSDFNETFNISSSNDSKFHGDDVFQDPKTFDFLQQLGNNTGSSNLRKISLYRKFDPLVESQQESPKQFESVQEDAKPLERNESGEYVLINTTTDDPPPETVHNISQKGFSDSYCSVPNTPDKLTSPRSEVFESSGNTVQELCVEISTSKMLSRSLDLFLESPKSQCCPRRQSTPKSYSSAQTKKPNDFPSLNDSEDALMTNYKKGSDNEKLREEVIILREILMKQENVYREDLNTLEQDVFDARSEVEELKKQVVDQKEGNEGLKAIMEEYEKTVSNLESEKEREKEQYDGELQTLVKEIDQLKYHLDQQEKSFSDLYTKYENSKTTLKQYEEREKLFVEEAERYHAAIRKMEKNYEILREHAAEKLDRANQELSTLRQNHQVEISKLRAAIRKYELKLSSLEETIIQKANENSQLTKLCDELINKVGMEDHTDESFQ